MPDAKMLMVAVAPAWLIRAVEEQFGQKIRKAGEMWAGDGLQDTEVELSDDDVVITITVKRRKKKVAG